MAKRWGYPGRTFTTSDNPRLSYPIRVLPDATVYAELDTGARRLNALATRAGLAISTLAEVPLLITRQGLLLVGDEIAKGKKDEPAKPKSIEGQVAESLMEASDRAASSAGKEST